MCGHSDVAIPGNPGQSRYLAHANRKTSPSTNSAGSKAGIAKQENIASAQDEWRGRIEAVVRIGDGGTGDETLRLLFVCCHPQLSTEAQDALALRTLCGFRCVEIAAAYLTTEAAIAKRLVAPASAFRDLTCLSSYRTCGASPAARWSSPHALPAVQRRVPCLLG